jgi:putative spermidine/putrescine transport system permease protein
VIKAPWLRGGLAIYYVIFIAFLYGPFIIMAILSFQPESGGPQFPLRGVSTYWYQQLLGLVPTSRVAPLPVGGALVRSLVLAFMTMVTSTVLGTLTAQAFRHRFKHPGVMFYLVMLGFIVPGVLLGLGTALVSNEFAINKHWWLTGYVVHVAYTFPFCFLVMLAIFNRFDRSVEEASASLGVGETTTFRKVTFPLVFPGILTSLLIAFTLSYDEFPRTLFAGGPQLTLPLAIYGTFNIEIHPNLFAFGVLSTLFSFAVLAVFAILIAITLRTRRRATGIQEEIR